MQEISNGGNQTLGKMQPGAKQFPNMPEKGGAGNQTIDKMQQGSKQFPSMQEKGSTGNQTLGKMQPAAKQFPNMAEKGGAGNQTTTKMPKGANPSPREKLAAATPHKISGDTPANLLYRPNTLSFWGNDVNGDCVTAEEAFAKACYNPEIFIPEQVAIDWAQSNGWLNGANLSEVLG